MDYEGCYDNYAYYLMRNYSLMLMLAFHLQDLMLHHIRQSAKACIAHLHQCCENNLCST